MGLNMALKKLIESESGIETDYHKLVFSLDGLVLKHYKSEDYRKSNKPAYDKSYKIELSEEENDQLYGFLYGLVKNKIPDFKDAEDC